MDAFEHYQLATTYVSEEDWHSVARELRKALAWIDETGEEKNVRPAIADLLATVEETRL